MDKNKIAIICLILIILLIVFVFRNNVKETSLNETISSQEDVYNIMMNTLTRDITNVDETEMTIEELEFYNKYLREENSEEYSYYNIIEE